ncbi:MAG: Zn-dependent hydrolase [Bacteroidaceae bacterium]|nr:Zn-dependent hydrolase [Bacteroidaceae bacterium]MBP5348552.1 Zn-dependent hydrolase [Bacteroidaceae bacterium]
MRKTIIIAALVLTTAVSCNKTPNSPFAKKVADYALVTLETPDLSGITDNGKEVLNLYRFIADEVDAIYWEQYFGNKNALLDGLTDPAQKEFAQINYGPWDRSTGKSFVNGYADCAPGAGFYPADMTAQEFAAFNNPDKNSPYTLIRRAANGNLETVWYHDAYKEHIDKIANYLKAAADITIKPSVKEYLLSKAQALQTDNYYESSIKWLDMDDSKMDLVVGPNEAADDQLLGVKRSYEAFVLLKNEARTNELMKYVSRIEEFQQDLPGDAAYKTFQPGTGSNIFSCNALYYAGKANAGVKVIALNLPFDADVQRDRGTRTILLENIINAKYNHIINPSGLVLLESDAATHLSGDAFFWNIVFREVAHGLGVKETIDGKGSVEDALGSAAITFEEIKANAAGILLVSKLQNHYDIRKLFTKEDALTTFFVSLVRSERFGEGSALGRANIIIYNYLEEAGAFQRKESGKYSLDYAKMESALSDLTALVLKTQATGDKAFATYFENCYSKRSENYDADLMNLALEKIPADIRFK